LQELTVENRLLQAIVAENMKQKKSIPPKTDYSKIAKCYDKVRTEPGTLLSQIIKYGGINSNSKVLDVGCGTGRFLTDLSSLTKCSLLGLEPSPEMLRGAFLKDHSRGIAWIQGDGQRLPFSDEVFDCVYMTFVLHHIERKDLALQEIYRVLKKGGTCVIVTTSHSQIKRHVLNNFPGVTAIDLKRFPSVLSIKRSMIAISFRNVHSHAFQRPEMTPTSKYLERVRNKYVSTLTLFSDDEFQRRFKVFQQRVRKKYGTHFKRIARFIFVEARK
jgi:ubiquinone/menaquinone biosynthesis C-methylase UbiE